MIIVDRQVPITLPQENSIACLHWFWFDQAHIDKDLDALLDYLLSNGVTLAIMPDLLKNGRSDGAFSRLEDFVLEHRHAFLSNELELIVLQVVSIQVLKTAVHHL